MKPIARLCRKAAAQHGYFTPRQATELGVTRYQLAKMRTRGEVQRVSRGLYRCSSTPVDKYDRFAEATLRVGPDAYLAFESVLALHQLVSTHPARVRVGTRHRVRKELPAHIEVIRRTYPEHLLSTYHGIRSISVAQAIIDCRDLVPRSKLFDVLAKAEKQGLVDQSRSADIRGTLRMRPPGSAAPSRRRRPLRTVGSARVTARPTSRA